MIYLVGCTYFATAAIFYILGQLTTDPKVANKPLALLAAVLWPISLLIVGGYAFISQHKRNA